MAADNLFALLSRNLA